MLFLRRLVAKLQALQSDDKEEYKIDPFVELYLNPNCKHTVTIRASLGEMWAQMVNIFVNNEPRRIKKRKSALMHKGSSYYVRNILRYAYYSLFGIHGSLLRVQQPPFFSRF